MQVGWIRCPEVVRERLTLLGFVAIILVFLVGFSALYQAVSSLRGEVSSLSRSVEGQGRAIEGLRGEVSAQGNLLRDLDAVKTRISSIEDSLRHLASAKDLERLAEELGRLSAELKLLNTRLTDVNESLRASVGELLATVDNMSRRVEALAELMLFPTTVVDGVGDKVVLFKKPSKIVSLAPSVTETLYYIGAVEALVGVDEWSDFPVKVKEMRDRGEIATVGYWSPKVEVIVGLKPDLVIGVASVPSHRALKSILSPYGIPVVLLPDFKLSDVEESILIAGRATGRVVEAYETLYKFKLAVNYAILLSQKVEYKPKVAAAVWVEPLFVVGGGTWEHDIVEVVGVNVYGDLKSWPQVSLESMLERAPEVIVLTSSYGMVSAEDLVNLLVSSLGDVAYEIPALKNGRVYALSGDYENSFVRPSPRTVLSIYVLLIVVHPQLFNLTIEDIPQSISPDRLDVISIISKVAPDPVVAFLREGLGG